MFEPKFSRSRKDRDEDEGNAGIQITGAKQVTGAEPIPSVSRRRKFYASANFRPSFPRVVAVGTGDKLVFEKSKDSDDSMAI